MDEARRPSLEVGPLVSPCERCGRHPVRLDYLVSDEFWKRAVPKEWRPAVLCWDCLNEISGGVPAGQVCLLYLTGQTCEPFVVFSAPSAAEAERLAARLSAKAWEERAGELIAERDALQAHVAVLREVLDKIGRYDATDVDGAYDEWTEAAAYITVKNIAKTALSSTPSASLERLRKTHPTPRGVTRRRPGFGPNVRKTAPR